MANTFPRPSPYWPQGLHDAVIIRLEELMLPYDYKQKNPMRNCLVLHLNSRMAMFDTKVKEIHLYNYKIISENTPPSSGSWWLSDSLAEENGKYVLTIRLQNPETFPEEFAFTVRFEKAEVVRK
ncbi:MAG: hypothetical protein IJW21_08655 [Clostridia bacterium]|nr:hypothetical protein [Clostridia bacterium]